MTVEELKSFIPVWGEMFPRAIQQEWTIQEYLKEARRLEKAILAGLATWRATGHPGTPAGG